MTQALRVRLTGRAARFVWLLQDFGHLDDERMNELYIALAELGGTPAEQLIDLPVVRRVAAAILFGSESLELDRGVLAEDWPILFS
jgi:hypothetical protein